ncbi:hypothetical protein ElyMa_004631400 [Elysia marginata]|uniref:Uncharacterized protein n=1 Tax=Elysia marginata TaxID=1093978 RepID=A0AAV4HZJ4_9GAST|nr:hypothetical protein ElyMa_004631400 [Elysia marginata]
MSPQGLSYQRSEPAPHTQTHRALSTNDAATSDHPAAKQNLHRYFSCSGQIEHPPKPKPHLIKDGGILQDDGVADAGAAHKHKEDRSDDEDDGAAYKDIDDEDDGDEEKDEENIDDDDDDGHNNIGW